MSTAVPVAAGIVVAVWLIAGWGGEQTVRVVGDLGLFAFALYATVCAGLAARSADGRRRTAWIFMTVALGGWTCGDAVWSFYELVLKVEPFPSPADLGYLLFPIATCIALVLFPVGSVVQSRIRLALDGMIVAASLFLVLWVTVLKSVYETNGEDRFALRLALAYPVADLVIITVAVLVLARAPAGHRITISLLTIAILLMALSDTVFVHLTARGSYFSGHMIDVGWLMALLLFGATALDSRGRPEERDPETAQVPSRASLWLPNAPVLLAGLVGCMMFLPNLVAAPVLVAALVLVIAVCVRQYVAASENRWLLARVTEQALRDPLTGLANRALFHDRLAHAMQLRARDDRAVAVLSMDLNDFKLVNDSLGHSAGDALLVRVAERLLACVRTGDTVARLGGDEFAVLMEGEVDRSHFVAERVAEAFDEPFIIGGQKISVRPSVGLAATTKDVELPADALSKQADVAMYSAKRSRSGALQTFSPEMHLVDPEATEMLGDSDGKTGSGAEAVRLLSELRRAIDHVDLSVVYQPKFDLHTAGIVGVEALLRWPHPDRGVLEPDQFLPLVRRHGLMRPVTDLVLDRALDATVHWYSRGVGVPIAVNLFAPFLRDLDLPARVARALDDRGLSPDVLTVEITEDLLLENIARTRTVLNRLRERGIRIAIDDFGSGYSALSYLRELPIDEVKLDRQFIAPILVDPRASAIVRAVIELAHVLGVTTVAEGVEDAQTAAQLHVYGCDVVQGFYYSPPVSATAILEMLTPVAEGVNRVRAPAGARSS